MTTLKGRFNGKVVILNDPIPDFIKPDVAVDVVFGDGEAGDLLGDIIKLAIDDDGLPADFSEQHEHYVYGTPKK
jgi:hypothetical protein